GDWLPGPAGSGGNVLTSAGVPVNSNITFRVVDLFDSNNDDIFKGGSKVNDNPHTATSTKWEWTLSKPTGKDDINNGLFHITQDATGHIWLVISGDRLKDDGTSYIDFEFLQNTLSMTTNVGGITGGFASAGTSCGRTVNDFLLTVELASGGSTATFFVQRWQAVSGGCGYDYVNATVPSSAVLIAVNSNSISVPYGAFGGSTYAANLFAEAAVDVTALIGSFDP